MHKLVEHLEVVMIEKLVLNLVAVRGRLIDLVVCLDLLLGDRLDFLDLVYALEGHFKMEAQDLVCV